MRRKFVIILLGIFLICSISGNIYSAKRTIYIDPAHGGLNTGFDFGEGKLEKSLNMDLALKLAGHLETTYFLSRTGDMENPDGPIKIGKIQDLKPDLIVGLHHHGKYGVHIEYNGAGRTIAYQLGAYFSSEDIPFKFVKYQGVWLFDLPQPVVVIIVNEEIAKQTDWGLIAKILEGLD